MRAHNPPAYLCVPCFLIEAHRDRRVVKRPFSPAANFRPWNRPGGCGGWQCWATENIPDFAVAEFVPLTIDMAHAFYRIYNLLIHLLN